MVGNLLSRTESGDRSNQSNSPVRVSLLLIAIIFSLSSSARALDCSDVATSRLQEIDGVATDNTNPIRLTIATVSPMLGAPTTRYVVGEQMLITISLTNTSNQPIYACVSDDLYQDLPKLTHNGRLVSYSRSQSYFVSSVERNQTCQSENLPHKILLRARESTIVDFMILVDDSRQPTGALGWYDPLSPGVYELSIQRRLGCCDGPQVESNKISFEVVP